MAGGPGSATPGDGWGCGIIIAPAGGPPGGPPGRAAGGNRQMTLVMVNISHATDCIITKTLGFILISNKYKNFLLYILCR